jgi:hypothetical protein
MSRELLELIWVLEVTVEKLSALEEFLDRCQGQACWRGGNRGLNSLVRSSIHMQQDVCIKLLSSG